jgi:type VI secretion system protein ImpJ
MLARRLSDTKQAGAADVIDLMLLQLSNKYEAIFNRIEELSPLHPHVLHTHLMEMLAEMATYTTATRRPVKIEHPESEVKNSPTALKKAKEVNKAKQEENKDERKKQDTPKELAYLHHDLFLNFLPLIHQSRHVLSMVLEQNAVAIQLDSQAHGLWRGLIHDKSLLKISSFVLSVSANLPLENIRETFAGMVKIAPLEKIQNCVSKGLPGIGLQSIAIAPRQIPYHAEFAYFILDTSSPLWQELQNSAGMGLHVGTHIPGLQLELWAIKDRKNESN